MDSYDDYLNDRSTNAGYKIRLRRYLRLLHKYDALIHSDDIYDILSELKQIIEELLQFLRRRNLDNRTKTMFKLILEEFNILYDIVNSRHKRY